MSEFKFACPVCGQHITADSSTSGGRLECPTCFRAMVVPQAPASGNSTLILSAAQVSGPRPTSIGTESNLDGRHRLRSEASIFATAGVVVLLCAAAATVYAYRDRLFERAGAQADLHNAKAQPASPPPRSPYPVPADIHWTLDVAKAAFPADTAAGSIHGNGFRCEQAILKGGTLSLRQGTGSPPDLGIAVHLFAERGEELSGKIIEVAADRVPPLPEVTMQWKRDQQQVARQKLKGGYALKLAFGKAANGRMPGKIYLCLPDDARSFVAGTFDAEIRKPSPPKTPKPATK